MIDILEGKKTEINGLLDGKGSVHLVDVGPRICPDGYTPEFRIVQAARVSLGAGIKTPELDKSLLRYLLINKHTSPLEMVNVTLRLKVPRAIAVHFLRHRTGKFNEFSQRYAEVPEDDFYSPEDFSEGIRKQSKMNAQGSILEKPEKEDEIRVLLMRAKILQEEINVIYNQTRKLGLANEVARFMLPNSQYSTLYMQFDLNNLLKLLTLRADEDHAQYETVVYSKAIIELVEPLFPTIFEVWRETQEGIFLSKKELLALKGEIELKGSEKATLEKKKLKL